jgi:hypothetical protein
MGKRPITGQEDLDNSPEVVYCSIQVDLDIPGPAGAAVTCRHR